MPPVSSASKWRRITYSSLPGSRTSATPPTYVLVQPVHAGVDERGALVVDEELIELKLGVRKLDGRADPVDPVDELIYAGHGWRSFPSLDVMAFLGF
jgi:hypothetical protein